MTEDEARSIWRRAKKRAARFSAFEEPEDFAQSVVLELLEKPDTKQSVSHIIVDIIRRTRGRPDLAKSAEGTAKQGARVAVPLEDIEGLASSDTPERTEIPKGRGQRESLDRAIFLLVHFVGFQRTEVAFLFGVSNARITQRLHAFEQEIKTKLLQAER